MTLRSMSLVSGVFAMAVVAAACGRVEEQDSDLLLGLQAVEPKALNVTDSTVHVTCKVIGARGTEDAEVEYIYGVADANGVAQAPLQSFKAFGGFADLTGLAADTTYAVSFVAEQNGKRGAFAPTLTFRTQKPLSEGERLATRVVAGTYVKATETKADELEAAMALVDDASCPSGKALAGDIGSLNSACMDFDTLTASREIGDSFARYTFDFCDCATLGADLRDIEAACTARNQAQGCKDQWGQDRTGVQFVVHAEEKVGGVAKTTTFLKSTLRK